MLDVPSKAVQKDIKLAYYKLAKKYHPDFQHDLTDAQRKVAEMQFKKILKSYEVLSNPISRQSYDIENQLNQDKNMD